MPQQNDNAINDSAACYSLGRRGLPDAGAYIGAHLVRSLLAARFDITAYSAARTVHDERRQRRADARAAR